MLHVRFDAEVQETQTEDKNLYLNGLVFKAEEGFETFVGQRIRTFLDANPDAIDLEGKTAHISMVPRDYIEVKTPDGSLIKSWNVTDVETERLYDETESKAVKAMIALASTKNLAERGTRTVDAKARPARPRGVRAAVAGAQPEAKSEATAEGKVEAGQGF